MEKRVENVYQSHRGWPRTFRLSQSCHSEAILIELRFFACIRSFVSFFSEECLISSIFAKYQTSCRQLSLSTLNACHSFDGWLSYFYQQPPESENKNGAGSRAIWQRQQKRRAKNNNTIDRKNECSKKRKKSKRDGIHCAKHECSKRPVDGWMANDISIVLFDECALALLRLSFFLCFCSYKCNNNSLFSFICVHFFLFGFRYERWWNRVFLLLI